MLCGVLRAAGAKFFEVFAHSAGVFLKEINVFWRQMLKIFASGGDVSQTHASESGEFNSPIIRIPPLLPIWDKQGGYS